MRTIVPLILAPLLAASPAAARDYCPERPGVGTPPCTIEPGRLSVEIAPGDWTRESDADMLKDTVLAGDLALRYGIADHAEVQLAWTPHGHVRTRDRMSGEIDTMEGTGDVTLRLKRNLVDPTGKQFSIALLPSVTLPTGGEAIGSGEWAAAMQVPLNVPLNDAISLIFTPEVDDAANQSRHGHHVAYGSSAGFAIQPAKAVQVSLEAQVIRDDDPEQPMTQAIAGLSAGVMLGENLQLDAGTEVALNRQSPDLHLYFGISRRF